MTTPTGSPLSIIRHDLSDHDPTEEVRTDVTVTVICGRVTGEIERTVGDYGNETSYRALTDDAIKFGPHGADDSDPERWRELAAIASFLADELEQARSPR